MSYKYGLNGNDLNWDMVLSLHEINVDLENAIFNGDIELDENGYVSKEDYQGYADSNPTIVYYKADKEVDFQEVKRKHDSDFLEYVDWYLLHDTNDNLVSIGGDVPDEYFTEDYIKERDEALGED